MENEFCQQHYYMIDMKKVYFRKFAKHSSEKKNH